MWESQENLFQIILWSIRKISTIKSQLSETYLLFISFLSDLYFIIKIKGNISHAGPHLFHSEGHSGSFLFVVPSTSRKLLMQVHQPLIFSSLLGWDGGINYLLWTEREKLEKMWTCMCSSCRPIDFFSLHLYSFACITNSTPSHKHLLSISFITEICKPN